MENRSSAICQGSSVSPVLRESIFRSLLTTSLNFSGANAIELEIGTQLDKSIIPFLDDLKDGQWFGNFDGTVVEEVTNWQLGQNTNTDSVTITLPQSAIASQEFFQIQEAASVILRTTPEIFPFPPKAMFAKAVLEEVFDEIVPFDCCVAANCQLKFGDPPAGQSHVCVDNNCDLVDE